MRGILQLLAQEYRLKLHSEPNVGRVLDFFLVLGVGLFPQENSCICFWGQKPSTFFDGGAKLSTIWASKRFPLPFEGVANWGFEASQKSSKIPFHSISGGHFRSMFLFFGIFFASVMFS